MGVSASAGTRVDPRFWAGKRVLLTGHTGFKGAWAGLWLSAMGAKVTAFALPAAPGPTLFALADVARAVDSTFGDLRDQRDVAAIVAQADPQLVLHLAAQPLVRRSFADPVETFSTNVMGTVHLLEALRHRQGLEAILVVTTDKVYANQDAGDAFHETDRLGGKDPYAASKAATELAVASYAASFFDLSRIPLATARGGNVIGGGDFSADRIVPDIWRALSSGTPLRLRYPGATRPWQYVLDCLAGYFLHLEALAQDQSAPRALNFGPAPEAPVTVAALAESMQAALGAATGWELDVGQHAPEMRLLAIDSRRARQALDWHDRLGSAQAIDATAQWYKAFAAGSDMRARTLEDIKSYGLR